MPSLNPGMAWAKVRSNKIAVVGYRLWPNILRVWFNIHTLVKYQLSALNVTDMPSLKKSLGIFLNFPIKKVL